MSRGLAHRHARVVSLLHAAARLADPHDPLGLAVRAELPATTGLSTANVELCLRAHLESHASPREVARLVASTRSAPRVHVLLSAHVFVGALRALALAAASAPLVVVRASRREPSFVRALTRAIDDPDVAHSIRLADDLHPAPGDEIHLYGRDETIADVCHRLDPAVRVRAHGAGIGVALVSDDVDIDDAAKALAADMVPFDQRGCLSPRVAFVHGSTQRANAFALALARALARWELLVPVGHADPVELAEQTRYRDTVSMLGESITAGRGLVGVATVQAAPLVAPTGRNMHVVPVRSAREAIPALRALAHHVAAVGFQRRSNDDWVAAMLRIVPSARKSALGCMQRPAFDGPVDLRYPGDWSPRQVVERLTR